MTITLWFLPLALVALIGVVFAYFQAACALSVAEKWLTDFTDLQNTRKNAALTRRLMRAIVGKEIVQSPKLLRALRQRFVAMILIMVCAMYAVLWAA